MMLIQNKQIAIVGGGPGGLTLAKLLQLKGVQVKLYERDIDKDARVQGSPLDLHEASGMAAIVKAGLLPAFKDNYLAGADREKIMNEKAEVLFSDHDSGRTEKFGDPHFRPEIDRGALRKILLESLEAGTVVWNSHFRSMDKQNQGWLLHFKNAESAYADIVIGADGANSKIRPSLTGIKSFYSGITMLEGNIYDASNKAPIISSMLEGGKIMAFGNAQNVIVGQKARGEIGFYASFKAAENWATDSGLDFSNKTQLLNWFKSAYPTWSDVWYELFENASMPIIPRPINCMPLHQTWEAQSNVTMLGDAAHVMPPFAGEGVNMAMLDALELSEALTGSEHDTVHAAVSSYEINMRKRASIIAQESLHNGEKMHHENSLAIMLDFFSGRDGQ